MLRAVPVPPCCTSRVPLASGIALEKYLVLRPSIFSAPPIPHGLASVTTSARGGFLRSCAVALVPFHQCLNRSECWVDPSHVDQLSGMLGFARSDVPPRTAHSDARKGRRCGTRPATKDNVPTYTTQLALPRDWSFQKELSGLLAAGLRTQVLAALGGPPGQGSGRPEPPLQLTPTSSKRGGAHSGDPDTQHLCNWLDNGAPLGYAQSIPSVGVFPKVESKTSTAQLQQDLHRLAELRLSRTRSARSGHAGCRLHRKGFLPHRQLHGRSHSRAWRTARAEQVRPHREGEPTRHQEVPADMGPPGIASQLHMLPRGTHPVAKTVGPGPTSSPTISTGQ